MSQVVMVSLDELVDSDNQYRKFLALWNFKWVKKYLRALEKNNNYKGYGSLRLFKCLLLQFLED